MDVLAWLPGVVPLVVGAVLACSGRRGDGVAAVVGVGAALVTLVLAVFAAVLRPAVSVSLLAGVSSGLAVDGLSAVFVVTVAAVTLAVLVFSAAGGGPSGSRARFGGLMLVFAGSMLVTVTATDLVVLLMGWEVMGAASWGLIGFRWHESHRVYAADVSFLTTRAGDLGLYLAAGAALAGGVDTLALADLPGAGQPWRAVLTAGLVVAALGKSAQVPFHFWLSRAMEGPSPVSALLHSATMVAAGGYLLLRLDPLLRVSAWAGLVVAWVGAVTAVVLGVVALAQSDLKQLLAASTSAQVGVIVLAAGVGGTVGGTMQVVAHAATKAALFLAVGVWLSVLGVQALPALRGAARRYRLVGVVFTVAAATLAGLPPLSLWVAKDEVLAVVLERSPALYAMGLVATVFSALYSTKAVWVLWRREPVEDVGGESVGVFGRVVLVSLAGVAAALGVVALPPLVAVVHGLVGGVVATPTVWSLVGSAVLAVLAAVLAWWWGDRAGPVSATVGAWVGEWLRVERVVRLVLVGPVLGVARGLAAFDDRVLGRAVVAVPLGGLRLARLVDRCVETGVDAVVGSVVAGARGLGVVARRPQTGQLHQYYAQVAAVLVVLAVLLVLVR